MNPDVAVRALGALAQETRLALFRRLVVAGPEGLPAGELASFLGVPAPTLSFHLKELEAAGLARRTRQGRTILCSADYQAMRALLLFLTEDCCAGRPEICSALAGPQDCAAACAPTPEEAVS